MAKEKQLKVEKTTREEYNLLTNYFKRDESGNIIQKEDNDIITRVRVYGVKTLQAYIKEIKDMRAKGVKVIEEYTRNEQEIELNTLLKDSGLNAMLELLLLEVKTAKISEFEKVLTGNEYLERVITYSIELY